MGGAVDAPTGWLIRNRPSRETVKILIVAFFSEHVYYIYISIVFLRSDGSTERNPGGDHAS